MSKQRTDNPPTASEPIFVDPPFDTPPPIADHADNGKTIRKPQTPKPRAKKRHFAKELADLERRVDTAVRLLNRCHDGGNESGAITQLIDVALEILTGE